MAFELTSDEKAQIDQICARYPDRAAALLPVLHLVQDRVGSLPPEVQLAVAKALGVPPTRVKEVVSFYEMFHEHPEGTFHLELCTNISCHLAGAHELMDHLEARLGIRVGEKTADGTFSLMEAECLASCGSGPVMKVGVDYYEYLTPDAVDGLLERLRRLAPEYRDKVYICAPGQPHVGAVEGFTPPPPQARAAPPKGTAETARGGDGAHREAAPGPANAAETNHHPSSAPAAPKKPELPSFQAPGAKK